MSPKVGNCQPGWCQVGVKPVGGWGSISGERRQLSAKTQVDLLLLYCFTGIQLNCSHATISITLDTYSHVLPGMGDAAAGAMDEALG